MANFKDDRRHPSQDAADPVLLNQEALSSLLEAARTGVWLMDQRFTTIYANHWMASILGLAPGAMTGRRLFSFMDPVEAAVCRRSLEGAPENAAGEHELPLVRADGEVRRVSLRLTPLRNGRGEVVHLAGTGRDVTEEMQELRRLREQANLLRCVLEGLDEAVLLLDVRGRLLEANPAAASLLGEDPARIPVDRTPRRLGPLLAREAGRKPASPDGLRFALSLPRPDGSFFFAEVHCLRIQCNRDPVLAAVVRDASELRRLQSQADSAGQALDSIAEVLELPLARLDGRGRVVQVNAAMERWTGKSSDVLLGALAESLPPPSLTDAQNRTLQNASAGQEQQAGSQLPANSQTGGEILLVSAAEGRPGALLILAPAEEPSS
jgi:PAS domain S-box-containing protein